MNVVLILTTLVSCGMAQKNDLDFIVDPDTIFAPDNCLNESGHRLVRNISEGVMADSALCMTFNDIEDLSVSYRISYDRLCTFFNELTNILGAEKVYFTVSSNGHAGCKSQYVFKIRYCDQKKWSLFYDVMNDPDIIEILEATAEQKKIRKYFQDTVQHLQKAYTVAFSTANKEISGIRKMYQGTNYILFTRSEEVFFHALKSVFNIESVQISGKQAVLCLTAQTASSTQPSASLRISLKKDSMSRWKVIGIKTKKLKNKYH